jgi:hypothetical protein
MANLILLIIVAVIAAVLLILRTNAILVFFALCAGNTLVLFASKNIAYVSGRINSHLLPHQYTVTKPALLAAMIIGPPVLVAAFAKHNNGPAKWPMQIFPAIATGVLGLLFITPYFNTSIQSDITKNQFWMQLQNYQVPIVVLCVATSTVLLILSTYSQHSPKKKHKA